MDEKDMHKQPKRLFLMVLKILWIIIKKQLLVKLQCTIIAFLILAIGTVLVTIDDYFNGRHLKYKWMKGEIATKHHYGKCHLQGFWIDQ